MESPPPLNSTTIILSQFLIHYIINYILGVLSDDIFETDSMNYRFFNKFVLYWHKNVDKWAANAALTQCRSQTERPTEAGGSC